MLKSAILLFALLMPAWAFAEPGVTPAPEPPPPRSHTPPYPSAEQHFAGPEVDAIRAMIQAQKREAAMKEVLKSVIPPSQPKIVPTAHLANVGMSREFSDDLRSPLDVYCEKNKKAVLRLIDKAGRQVFKVECP